MFPSTDCLRSLPGPGEAVSLTELVEEVEEIKPSARDKRLLRLFSLDEIKSATNDFDDLFVIGKGAFGKVYKGTLDDGKEMVAIKRLKSNSRQGKHEFLTEIEALSEVRHVNLVSLIGYCEEQLEMILVYEYMPSGSLADHLYKLAQKNKVCSPLSWTQRLNICIGAARGLDYLHTGHRIIHRDVKASNILLDEHLMPTISDFGLAIWESGRVLQNGVTEHVKGTPGYMDPYFSTREITTKSDTYSFGVVLLEVLLGRPALEPFAYNDGCSLTIWATNRIRKDKVNSSVDSAIKGEILQDSLTTFLSITGKCLQYEPIKRPTIGQVLINLELALEQQKHGKSMVPKEITPIIDFLERLTSHSSLPSAIAPTIEQSKGQISSGIKKLAWFSPFSVLKIRKPTRTNDIFPQSAPTPGGIGKVAFKSDTALAKGMNIIWESDSSFTARVFSFSELMAATEKFSEENIIGRGGFGIVYKGWVVGNHGIGFRSRYPVAVKRLRAYSSQGMEVWEAIVAKTRSGCWSMISWKGEAWMFICSKRSLHGLFHGI